MGDKVKVQELDPHSQEKFMDLFKGVKNLNGIYKCGRPNRKGPVTIAPGVYVIIDVAPLQIIHCLTDIGCFLPSRYKNVADNIRNMVVRPDDVWVATFPRCGTTWIQELVWIIMNNFDYDTALKIPLIARFPFLEVHYVADLTPDFHERMDPALYEAISKTLPTYENIVKAPSPRFIKTHIPFSLLPEKLLDTTKVVYVARDPRDAAVSFYHHNRSFHNYSRDFKSYWNLFINDLIIYTPFFPHLKEAWALRDHPNMLFMFYEEMIRDLPTCIKRVANFFGKEVSNEQLLKLAEHLDIKNFKKNESVNPPWISRLGPSDSEGFVRKGKSGGWQEYFDEEMAAQAQKWLRENLAGTDLRFPDASSIVATLVSI